MRKNLTEGSVTKTVITTALPMMAALLVQTLFNVVDAIYVGRLSAEAIAAVSLAFPIMFFIFAISGGIGVGATTLIAQFVGSKEYKKADDVAEHALVIGTITGIIISILGLIFSRQILEIMGADAITDLALDYINPIFIGTTSLVIFGISGGIFRGEGDTKTPTLFMIIATVTNIILDPIFIFVLGMGVKGAAIATVISNLVGCISIVTGLMGGKSSIKINFRAFRFKLNILKKMFKIGFPSSISQLSMSISSFVMMAIVASFGTYAIAAYGIVARLDSIAVLPALGVMMAVIPIVGQNIGAKKLDRAEKTAYSAAMVAGIFSGIVGLLFFLFPKLFVLMFNGTPQVVEYATLYLRIVPLFYVFIGINICMTGAYLGAGSAMTSLFFTLLRVIIIVIPAALFFAFSLKLGLLGVWLAAPLSILISAVSSVLWFRTGRWKKNHLVNVPEIVV